MSYLRHIRACNAHDLAGFRDLRAGGQRVGRVRPALARRLSDFPGFAASADAVELLPDDFAGRSAAVAAVVDALVADGTLPGLRHEHYPALPHWGAPPLFSIDRAAIVHFGIAAYGLHVNGYVRQPDGLHLWLGHRARDRAIAPGQLDNLVGGGQPIGLTLDENLLKEAEEEAGLTAELAGQAVPVGAIRYVMEVPEGVKPDTLFLYDLELPAGFVPHNTDGEVEKFELWPLAAVAERLRTTDDFKFNVNLVLIDFLIRHGFIRPDHPDYLDLITGLHPAVD